MTICMLLLPIKQGCGAGFGRKSSDEDPNSEKGRIRDTA